MGDHLATIDMGRKVAGAVPLSMGEMSPHLIQCAWAEAYLHTKWYPDTYSRLATIDMGRKVGAVPPFFWGGGELGPHLTQCRLD